MIDQIAISGYRSIESMILTLGQLNVITGENGSGKSNLYRALKLIADAAHGRLGESIATEGGFHSVRWAGPKKRKKDPVSLRLGFTADPYSYCMDLGLPIPIKSAFDYDPEMKRECLWRGNRMEAKALVADRKVGSLRCRGESGKWQQVDLPLSRHGSMLTEYSDPFNAPELIITRELICSWRFYDTFRVDRDSPARRPSIATFTPVLAGDGRDLAASLQTIREIGDHEALNEAIETAFPGSSIWVESGESQMEVKFKQPMLRDLSARELSDGTLRYLLLVAALLTPRPPAMFVLNEPENSLHPNLIPALAKLIQTAAERSQIIVVSHHPDLVALLEADEICVPIRLVKEDGETTLQDGNLLNRCGWKWPSR